MGEVKTIEPQDYIGDRNFTCCFTGHRNKDLPFGGDVHKQGMKCLLSLLHLLIEEAIKDGYTTFISGMADGIDLYCAEIVHNLSVNGKYGKLKLVCALPYAEQSREMTCALDKYRYSLLTATCDEIVVVSDKSNRDRYKLRNQFMVESSSRIIGVYKEKERGSGTLQTINMAKRACMELEIISLDSNPQLYVDTDKKIDTASIIKL